MSREFSGLPVVPRDARAQVPLGYQFLFLATLLVMTGSIIAGFSYGIGFWKRLPGISLNHRAMADEWSQTDRPDLAAIEFRDAEAVNPLDVESIAKLGEALAAIGDTRGGIEAYRRARARAPRVPEIHNLLGQAHFEQGRISDAIGCFREAVWLKPDSPDFNCNLAMAYYTKGDLALAERYFNHAIKLNPHLAEAHNGLGAVHASRHEFAEAEQAFAEALRNDPDLEAAKGNLERARRDNAAQREKSTPNL